MTRKDYVTIKDFSEWLAYYQAIFADCRDNDLRGYWWMHGRDSEESTSPRKLAAWSAVNAEMQARGL